MTKQTEVQAWFDSLSLKTALTIEEERAVWDLVGHPGLGALWGLMIGQRQGLYLALANAQLFDPAQVNRAAVIQGQIKGIEVLFETLLELATPADASAAEGAPK